MPQPLSSITKGKGVGYWASLPEHDQPLCMLALKVIAEWSMLESAVINLITALFPGRAGPIAKLYIELSADSPKRAMLSALAHAVLTPDEIQVYEKLNTRYKSASKLRNPLAHWVLGHGTELPGYIIAVDGRDLTALTANMTDQIAKRVQDAMAGRFPETTTIADPGKDMLKDAQAYSASDLKAISKEISTTSGLFLQFRFYLNWRIQGIHTNQLPQLWRQLLHDLG